MSKRYVINSLSLVAAVYLIVESRVFTGSPLEWVGFGVSAGIAAAGIIGLALSRLPRHLAGFSVLTAVAAWSAVAALVFSGGTLAWLVFADAVALAVIAFGALAIHEVTTERVVHTLEIREEVLDGSYEAV